MKKKEEYLVAPNIFDKSLTRTISGYNENFKRLNIKVIHEKSLTIFLNNQEIVTLMSIGDHPKYLAIGYLLNKNILKIDDELKSIIYEKDIETIVIRTKRQTNFEKKLKKKITTSGCAQGTVFGDIYEEDKCGELVQLFDDTLPLLKPHLKPFDLVFYYYFCL